MQHKYSLEKYRNRASRHTCPQCNKAQCFALYIDNTTGEPINEAVGRCNRTDKCGYHYPPSEWFKNNTQQKDNFSSYYYNPKTVIHKPKPIGTISKEHLTASIGADSNFYQFLCSLFDADSCRQAMQKYHLGCCEDRKVIFWLIDKENRIRTGKIMQYNPHTGKRAKEKSGSINWTHSNLKHKGILPDDYNLVQCLFGEHLLSQYPDATVGLVESEKTAVICSIWLPKYIWLATGGKHNFKSETLSVLKGRKVVVYPDLGAYSIWSLKAQEVKGVNMVISDVLESMATNAERKEGYDMADYFIQERKKCNSEVDSP